MKAALVEKKSFGLLDTLYTLRLPEPLCPAPGQFAELRISNELTPFLRRPISIFHAENNLVNLLVRRVGIGTTQMSEWQIGHETDILIPLGHGFTWTEGPGNCLLVAGGIGLAPLNYLAEKLLDAGKTVRLLFLPKRDDRLLASLHRLDEVHVLFAENRTELPQALSAALDAGNGADGVYVCGPEGMMRVVTEICTQKNIECQVSMEERMGCGFGICVGCAVRIKSGNAFVYKKACTDGPVFPGAEVIFHE
ncbi:MAG: hypothetical protein LBK57_03195 [Clostridiales Family XIII bacterium]|jgi:dihydroorotate dehydrogenase electron transfer subunit|nr:hypothetical protein [Clostridiales Family XIII bacterium]